MNIFKRLKPKNTDDVFLKNEIIGNSLSTLILLIFALITVFLWFSFDWSIIIGKRLLINSVFIISFLSTIFCLVLLFAFRGRKRWIKYAIIILFVVAFVGFSCFGDYIAVTIILVIPIALSCIYFMPKFTIFATVFSIVMLTFTRYFSVKTGLADLDLNYVVLNLGEKWVVYNDLYTSLYGAGINIDKYLYLFMVQSHIPTVLVMGCVGTICSLIANRGKKMVWEQAEISAKNERIKNELELASKIQESMLPKNLLSHEAFNINAMMKPAKEVGGDFYDYFMTAGGQLAFVVADVSDKGVPAALFMAKTKTLLRTFIEDGVDIAEAFNKVNIAMSDNNEWNMFVTMFAGIIDPKTYVVTCVNAGHCRPLLRKNDNNFEYIDIEPDLVVGSFENLEFTSHKFEIKKGDRLFLYTDGVTEATSKDKVLYGEERLLDFMNKHKEMNVNEITETLGDELTAHLNGVEQNDDITMLVIDIC